MKKQFSLALLGAGIFAVSLTLISHAAMPGVDAGMILNQAMREQQMRNTSPYMFSPFTQKDVIQWNTPSKPVVTTEVKGHVINSEPAFNKSLESFKLRNYPKAIQLSNKILKDNPYYTKAYFVRGASKFYSKDYKGALEDANIAIQKEPTSKYGYNIRSAANLFLHNTNQSLADCEKSLTLDSQNAFANSICSVGYTLTNQYEKATSYANKALSQDPSLAEAYLARGYVNLAQGKFEPALADSNKVIELYPQAALGYTLRAYSKMGLNQNLETAKADAQKSIQLNPDLPFNYVVLGTVYKMQREDIKTVQNYETAIHLFEKSGNKEKANLIRNYLNDYKEPENN